MTAHDRSRFLSIILSNPSLLGAGVVVIEKGTHLQVVRRPDSAGPSRYVTLYQIDATNRDWSDSNWRHNLRLQLVKAGAPATDVTFAAVVGGDHGYFLSVAPGPSVGASRALLDAAAKGMQETQMSFNLQYVQLQNQMQSDNRSYTAVSNIMKTKHDAVKNSISNIR